MLQAFPGKCACSLLQMEVSTFCCTGHEKSLGWWLVRRAVDSVAQALFKAGKIADLCEGAGFFGRLTALERQYPSASVLVHKQGVLPPEIAALWSSPALMAAARQFLGGDVAGHPVWNLRAKTPQQEQATVPWHQVQTASSP